MTGPRCVARWRSGASMTAAWLLMNPFFPLPSICVLFLLCELYCPETLTFGSESETSLLGDLNLLRAC